MFVFQISILPKFVFLLFLDFFAVKLSHFVEKENNAIAVKPASLIVKKYLLYEGILCWLGLTTDYLYLSCHKYDSAARMTLSTSKTSSLFHKNSKYMEFEKTGSFYYTIK